MNRLTTLGFVFLCGLSLKAGQPVFDKPPSGDWADFVEPNFPFFGSSLDARKIDKDWPTNNLTARGIVLNLGHGLWACFDTDLIRMAAIWTGKGVSETSMAQISYHDAGKKAVEGEEHLPEPIGTPWLANGIYPGWQTGAQFSMEDPREPCPDKNEIGRGALPASLGKFNAIRFTRDGIWLEYNVGATVIHEIVSAGAQSTNSVVQRRFEVAAHGQELLLALGRKSSVGQKLGIALAMVKKSYREPVLKESNGFWIVHVPGSKEPQKFSVIIGLDAKRTTLSERPEHANTTRWPEVVKTKGHVSASKTAYATDNIEIPAQNPWRRNVRLTDISFFPDGRAAAVSFDGDVWMISGLGGDLKEIKWRRFASGLCEPMSLCIRDNEIYVFDRNGIWRMRDTDKNGEADLYELFSNAFAQTAETREYAHGMKLAPDGSFVIGKGGIQMSHLGKDNGKVMRISPDGKTATTLGYGFRSPYVGVHPKTGLVTASDQQGNYVPATPLHIVRDNQFYGFLSRLLPKEKYPAPIADPLTWIPYPVNSSGASQVWLVDAKMGPLNDHLIHLAYFRPEIFTVLLNNRARRTQAAVLSLTRDLQFSPMNGAINPVDGQLYVIGFQIFGTAATQISGLSRIRYTGAQSTIPTEVIPMDKGMLLRFDFPLDPQHATNLANYSAERWNYKRTADYGSPHFKLDGTKGQDAMTASSAYLSNDGKTVFVGIPDMKPVMQMRFGWSLASVEGKTFEQNAVFTPYELVPFVPSAEGFPSIAVDLEYKPPSALPETPVTAEEGKRLATVLGCELCHSNDGSTQGKVGPTWKKLFASERLFADGSKTVATETYLRESIQQPAARIVRGFEKGDVAMPSYEGLISESQIQALILYIKSLR
jgi:hypothetical protein